MSWLPTSIYSISVLSLTPASSNICFNSPHFIIHRLSFYRIPINTNQSLPLPALLELLLDRIVAPLTQRLKRTFPELLHISSVWFDVVAYRCRCRCSVVGAYPAKRFSSKLVFSYLSPSWCSVQLAELSRAAAIVWLLLFVRLVCGCSVGHVILSESHRGRLLAAFLLHQNQRDHPGRLQ